MALTLPTELVHYIIELALPPRTSATGTIRRQRLKVFSLVHRSWTPQAHQMLFEDLSLRLTQGEAECARVEALVALARRKSRPRRLDIREPGGIGLSLPMSSTETLVSLPLTEKLLKLCPDVTEIRFRTVGFSSKFGGVLPEWSWPRGMIRLSLIHLSAWSHPLSLPPGFHALHLSYLLLVDFALQHSLPPLPNLQALLLDGTAALGPDDDLRALRSLHTFAIPYFSSSQRTQTIFEALPPTLQHFRLDVLSLPLRQMTRPPMVAPLLEFLEGLPTELRTVEVNIRRPFPVLPKELVASTLSDMVESTVKVRGPEETPIRLELWEPGQ